jgi:hypothetical protein
MPRLVLARRLAALAVVLAAIATAASLFGMWHLVHEATVVDADALFGAIYLGPDYAPAPGARSEMLERSIGTRSWACTGLEHVGIGVLVASIAVGLAAIVTARWPSRPSITRAAAVTVILALAHAGFSLAQATLRHLLDRVGPELPAGRVFTVAEVALVLASVVLMSLAIAEARRTAASALVPPGS